MSIDRNAITKSITKGGQIPAFTFTPPNTKGYYAKNNAIRYDPKLAKKFLSQAGFENGPRFSRSDNLLILPVMDIVE